MSRTPAPPAHTEVPIFRTAEQRARLLAIYDAKLGSWPVPFRTLFVPTRYGTTHVIATGDPAAPPLVLLHPAAVAGFVWSPIIQAVSGRRRVYALDTIGELGRSELDSHDRYAKHGRDFSAWLHDAYRGLGIRRADVIGGSAGGWIALQHAINTPQQVKRLVLFGPMGLPSWRSTLGVLVPLLSMALRPTDAKLEALTLSGIGHGDQVNREMLGWLRIAGRCRARVGMPLRIPNRHLRRITAPTLLFLGGNDGAIGSATAAAQRARRTIPGCQIEILPQAGHLMFYDEPDLVGTRITRFLTGAG